MGTQGYRYAAEISYQPNEVILEVGSQHGDDGESTRFLSSVGPSVVTIDIDPFVHDTVAIIPNVRAHLGRAEDLLQNWRQPIGFAWLDGHDWPYDGNPFDYYKDQRSLYRARGQEYSRGASRCSHLDIAELILNHARVIAFDDTWKTHAWQDPDSAGACGLSVPPATPPAPMLAMNEGTGLSVCGLLRNHPHHDDPERGWNGKGGEAIPFLLDHGFRIIHHGLCLVILEKG